MTDVYVSATNKTLRQTKTPTFVRFTVADLICTLPPSNHATKGKRVTVTSGALSSGTGVQVAPASGGTIYGAGITQAADKSIINSGATDVAGDTLEVIADGAGNWHIVSKVGTWARQA